MIIWSSEEKDKPIPRGRGQIIYVRNAFQINNNSNPTFLLSAKFPEWRVIQLVNEEKSLAINNYVSPNGVLFTDGGGYHYEPRSSVIGTVEIIESYLIIFLGLFIKNCKYHLSLLHISMKLGDGVQFDQIFKLARHVRGKY